VNIKAKFGKLLQQALIKRYGRVPSAAFVAREFNLKNSETSAVTQESARRWIAGISIPNEQRLEVLINWLKIDFNQVFATEPSDKTKADQSEIHGRQLIQIIENFSDAEKLIALRLMAALQKDLGALLLKARIKKIAE